MFYVEILIGKIINFVIRLIDKKRGTNLTGKIILKLDKDFIKKFKKLDYSKIIVVTGTNGKSTTTNLLNHLFKKDNKVVVSNLEGANLITGITTILIKNCTLTGKFKNDYFIFEIDERTLPRFFENIPAKNLAVTNIQKDQVCRNGEPDYIYQIIKKVIKKDMKLFLNNEDPRSKALEDSAKKVIYYSVNKNKDSYEKTGDKIQVTMPCTKCFHKIDFNYYNIPNIGNFKCSHCSYKSEDKPKYQIDNVNYKKGEFTIFNETIKMPYVEKFMIYNYVLAYAISNEFGVKNIKENLQSFKNIDGRIEQLNYNNKKLKYLRIKQENPETLQSALNYVSKDKTEKVFILGLCLLKDFKPYYSNTFYSYDCDFSGLVKSNIKKYICFSEAVAPDTANRLIYGGVDKNKIIIVNNDDVEKILKEVDKTKCNNIYLITWIHTYEDIKKYLKSKGE
jgi:UDP-N-acetylmuramyl tripeptide synthase